MVLRLFEMVKIILERVKRHPSGLKMVREIQIHQGCTNAALAGSQGQLFSKVT